MATQSNQNKKLKIIQWNANGLRTKVGEFISFLSHYKIDIAIINETKLTPNNKLKIRNFTVYRNDRNVRGGGVAIVVRHNLPHIKLPQTNSLIEHISIKLLNGIILSGGYARPNLRMNDIDFHEIFNLGQQVMLLGDLNARHRLWKNIHNNRNGHLVHDYATNNNIQLLTTTTPTHYPMNNMTPSYIDIILNKNILNLPDIQVLDELSSDHRPLLLDWKVDAGAESGQTTWIYSNANWRKFRDILNNKVEINNNIHNIDILEAETALLTANLQFARNKIAKKICIKPAEDLLPREIINLIKFKNKIRKRWQRTRNPIDGARVRQLENNIRTQINKHKNNVWTNTLNGLSVQDNSLWKLTRRLKNKFNKIPSFNQQVPQTDMQKATTIAQHFASVTSGQPNTSPEQDIITNIINKTVHKKYPIPPNILPKLYTSPQELTEVIKSLPNNKAPGPDEVAYIILKNIPRKVLAQLTYIINET